MIKKIGQGVSLFLGTGLFLLFFLSSRAAQGENLDDYLLDGSFFDYRVVTGGTTYLDDPSYASYSGGSLYIPGYVTDVCSFDLEFLRVPGGLELSYEYIFNDNQWKEHVDFYNPGFFVLRDPLFVGQKYSIEGTYEGYYDDIGESSYVEYLTGVSKGVVTVSSATITVPAGRYSCLLIKYTGKYTVPGKSGKHEIKMYLAKSIGLVRFDYVTRDRSFSLLLEEATLPPIPPKPPTILAPTSASTVSLTPVFQASPFVDLTIGGDIHRATIWEVYEQESESLVWDWLDEDTDKTTQTVPPGVLDYRMDYFVQVCYGDGEYAWSEWSEPVFFTTETVLHPVTFALGPHGVRTGGGALTQSITHREPAVPPVVQAESGWEFAGWDPVLPDLITAPWSGTALYIDIAPPELRVSPLQVFLSVGSVQPDLLDGVTAVDSVDGDVTHLVRVTGTLGTSQLGNYSVTYQGVDTKGNVTGEISRLYTVVPQSTPWELVINSTPVLPHLLKLGSRTDATDEVDDGVDLPAPVAGDAASAFLSPPSPGPALVWDFRAVEPETDFILTVQAPAGQEMLLAWDPAGLPANRHLSIWEISPPGTRGNEGEAVGGTTLDMSVTHEISVPAGVLRTFMIRASYDLTVDLRLEKGWNLLTLPVTPHLPQVDKALARAVDTGEEVDPPSVWMWSGVSHQAVRDLQANRSYWVYSPLAQLCMVRGVPVEPPDWEVLPGWNLLGSPFPMETLPDIGDQLGPVWGYDNQTGRFVIKSSLTPQSAVWIHALNSLQVPLRQGDAEL